MKALALVMIVLSATALAADPVRGERLYTARCGACHSIDGNGAGPRHRGLFGRMAGTQPDFEYSVALKSAGVRWNSKSLDRWLANPSDFVPGNKMVVQLVNDPTDRADVIAYLAKATALLLEKR